MVKEGLVIHTWGNASGVDRARGVMVIKPSGVDYDGMHTGQMVAVDIESGKVVEGSARPSSDTPTHLELYRAFKEIGGIVHTHSLFATAWAQACREIPAFGTTHADYWQGNVPCTRQMTADEVKSNYEINTGRVIIETVKDPARQSAILVAGHGPFTWGASASDAVHNAVVLEFVAQLAAQTLALNPGAEPIAAYLLDKHFLRKHGPGAYYGQPAPKANL